MKTLALALALAAIAFPTSRPAGECDPYPRLPASTVLPCAGPLR